MRFRQRILGALNIFKDPYVGGEDQIGARAFSEGESRALSYEEEFTASYPLGLTMRRLDLAYLSCALPVLLIAACAGPVEDTGPSTEADAGAPFIAGGSSSGAPTSSAGNRADGGSAGNRAGGGSAGSRAGGGSGGARAQAGETSAGSGGTRPPSGVAGSPSSSGGRSGGGAGRGQTAGSGPTAGAPAATAGSGSVGPVSPPPFGERFVGNITTHNAVDTDGKTFSRHWNQITPENAGKWGSVQSSAGSGFNWRTLDAIYDYAEANDIIFKQHTFIWGTQQPGGSINEAAVKNWMTEFCTRYPNTKLIDVVNEPPPHTTPAYANSIGGGTNGSWQWVINAFKWAREACPNAILIFNDYNNIEWQQDSDHFIGIVKTALAGGAPIDAIGAQAHDLDHAQVTHERVEMLLTKLHEETGLPIYITEFDISTTDDNAQLSAYQHYIPYFMGKDYIKGITIWGWIYGKTWASAPNSGLIRNGSNRPAMTWLMEQLGRPAP